MPSTTQYVGITGVIERISSLPNECCNQFLSLNTMNGTVNFTLSPGTYITDNTTLRTGIRITVFYDNSLPVPLIYPPQYQAAFVSRNNSRETIMVAYFDKELLSVDKSLKINIDSSTFITTANGQEYNCPLGNNLLMVFYTTTTRSIPPQTTPKRIIIFC